MKLLKANADAGATTESQPLRWHRTVAVAFSILVLIVSCWKWVILYFEPSASDFLSYWAAAKLALDGNPVSAYDIEVHRALELSVAPLDGILPFPYPPPFLLLLLPFGLGPYWLGFAAWVTATAALYIIVARHVAPLVYGLAHPGVLANALIGQNGFLTTAIFIAGTRALQRHPLLGGAILGLTVVKPQLALLFPLALLAGREWRAIAGAAMSSAALLLVAAFVLGLESYLAFFDILPVYTNGMATNRWPWNEFASVFAFARHLGMPQEAALVVHGAVAILAAVIVWKSWSERSARRVPVLAAAALLIPPYMMTYDSLLLIVPMGWMIRNQRDPAILATVWAFCLLPIASYFEFYPGPNTIPLAALLCLWVLRSNDGKLTGEGRFGG